MRKKNLCQEIKTIDAANVIHENDNILEQTLVQRSKNENFTVNRFNLTLLWLLIFFCKAGSSSHQKVLFAIFYENWNLKNSSIVLF